ncbi:hypothetical protein BGZ61DRAFT_453188 [Ilyonectria robusta]|uniref:uncharacterized protein n=1 Tax=Ilyonectria robusta TaxID=1079257 RepID=UPI001E8DD014|nr:uncharacterized protein BGZ61DRAFT_453188 [Ilyonectria robusta]KAH8688417.1 hypothetical protein BGZ61DRAFT_453188 [Ilyonectria robusta]
MLFKTLFTAVAVAVSALAAPLEERDTSQNKPHFNPSATWAYNVRTGEIASTSRGVVSKFDANKGNDITALLTFTYPAASKGKQCQFAFYLNDGGNFHGSGKIDLFSSLTPAPGTTATWPPGNQRNQHLARLSVARGQDASYDATYSTYLTKKTPCKAPGTKEGFELVGVYDNDFVSWNLNHAGPRIVYT